MSKQPGSDENHKNPGSPLRSFHQTTRRSFPEVLRLALSTVVQVVSNRLAITLFYWKFLGLGISSSPIFRRQPALRNAGNEKQRESDKPKSLPPVSKQKYCARRWRCSPDCDFQVPEYIYDRPLTRCYLLQFPHSLHDDH